LRRHHGEGEATLFPSCSFSARFLRAPVGPFAGRAIALAAACALAVPVALAAEPVPRAVSLLPPSAPASSQTRIELGRLIDSSPGLAVGGERLNIGLLRRFYAGHGFEPIWARRQFEANSLLNAVLRAGDHGLAPELFHANLLRNAATLPALERELLLSDAFLSYADALARGAMPVERRMDDEALTPEPIDVAAALDAAIRSPDPAAAIEALAPTTPTYRALRQALQNDRLGARAGDKVTTNRPRQIEVNLERQRWLPRRLPADRVWVNAADARLVLYQADRPVFSTRVIVGQEDRRKQSPEFRATIDAVLFNPPWNIPETIADDIRSKLSRDPDYLARRNMVTRPDGGLQQLPGPGAGLGQIKFEMENRFDVYLHDTPSRNLFNRDNRRISLGCIRVQNPRELTALLMRQPIDAINDAIAAGGTTRRYLPMPVPVFVVYQTAFVDLDGTLQFRPDVYNRDAEIWTHLHPVNASRLANAGADLMPRGAAAGR
jgi:murein L,D-transpeptidase YcbB/YkuD